MIPVALQLERLNIMRTLHAAVAAIILTSSALAGGIQIVSGEILNAHYPAGDLNWDGTIDFFVSIDGGAAIIWGGPDLEGPIDIWQGVTDAAGDVHGIRYDWADAFTGWETSVNGQPGFTITGRMLDGRGFGSGAPELFAYPSIERNMVIARGSDDYVAALFKLPAAQITNADQWGVVGEATVSLGGHGHQLPWRGWLPFDLNGDGFDDRQTGRTVDYGPTFTAPAVPEPTAWGIAIGAVAWWPWFRRPRL